MNDAPRHTAFSTFTDRLLDVSLRASLGAPRRTLAVGLLLAVACLLYAASSLELRADRNAMIREGRPWNERFLAYRENFEGTRDLIVVLRDGTPGERTRFADRLAQRLGEDRWIEHSFHRVDPQAFEGKGLLFLDRDEFEDLAAALEENQSDLVRLASAPSLDGVLRLVDRRISSELVGHLVSGLFASGEDEDEDEQAAEQRDPVDLGFLITLLEDIETSLTGFDPEHGFESPWVKFFGGSATDQDGYLTARDGELLFVIVTPRTHNGLSVDGKAIRAVREHLGALSTEFPEVRYGVTGERAIAAAEMRATVEDTKRASGIALVGVAGVFVLGFGRVRNPLLAVATLVIGICWSAGSTTLLVGHLTVLSVAFTSILIGLGIDFGIHIVARYEEERGRGAARTDALERAVRGSGPGNVGGAITTALAFFALALSGFLGIAELGIIAGAGVLLCLLANLFMLPALIMVVPDAAPTGMPISRRHAPGGFARKLYAHPRTLVTLGVLGVVAGLVAAPRLEFDANLLELQAKGTEEVDLELELVSGEGFASAFAVATASDLDEASALTTAFEELDEVARVESLAQLVPPDQPARRERARSLAPLLEPITFSEVPPPAVEVSRLARRVNKLRFKLRPDQEARWSEASRPEAGQIQQARSILDRLHERFLGWAEAGHVPRVARAGLDAYQGALVDDLADRVDTLAESTDPGSLVPADVPADVRRRLVGHDGRLLLRIFPTENIWEDEPRERFVFSTRSVDPEVTGIPLQMLEASKLMRTGYLRGGGYALLMVVAMLWLDFRRARDVGKAFLPLAVGGAWTLGLMALLGLGFNLANLVILPLMIGIGIDIGIHTTHRALQDGQTGAELVSGSTGRAVLLSGLTTAIGFGTLAVARHQGLHSLGVLVGIGVLANVAAALLVLAPSLELARVRSVPLPSRVSPESDASAPHRNARE